MQDLDLYFRSNGDQNNSFHLKAVRVAQKNSSNIFLKNKKNRAMLDRSIPTRKALIHSIPISEVKDMTSNILWTVKASLSKKKL
jgi:hypothetical protein